MKETPLNIKMGLTCVHKYEGENGAVATAKVYAQIDVKIWVKKGLTDVWLQDEEENYILYENAVCNN
jgi:hypothetical protein